MSFLLVLLLCVKAFWLSLGSSFLLKRFYSSSTFRLNLQRNDAITVYDNTLDSRICNSLNHFLTNYASIQLSGLELEKNHVLSIPFRVFDRHQNTSHSTNAGFKFVEKIIDSILSNLNDDSQFVEYWWRGHWSNHVLHRDVDEQSCFRDNIQRYPRNAHVLYLSYEDSLVCESGGHTVVLEDGGDHTRHLFIVPPLPGRLLRFDGHLLHGVPRPALEYFLRDQPGEEVKQVVGETLQNGGSSQESTLDVSKLSFSCEFSNSIRRSVILFNTWPDVAPSAGPTPSEDCSTSSSPDDNDMLSNAIDKWRRRDFVQPGGDSISTADSDWTLRFLLPSDRRRRDGYEKTLALLGSRADVAGFLIQDARDRPPAVIALRASEDSS